MKTLKKRLEAGKSYHLCNPCIEELDAQGLPAMNDGIPFVNTNKDQLCDRCGKIADRILNVILLRRMQ
jgi:hypothetical protein